MAQLLIDNFRWIMALHVISVISWMAGLLYLPRLFVYHADAPAGSAQSETFKTMERRLLRGIMNPAMIATYVFGILLALAPGVVDWSSAWIYVKLAMVAGLTATHHAFGLWRKDFAADRNRRPARFYRVANEAPTLMMIVTVVMVIVKPF